MTTEHPQLVVYLEGRVVQTVTVEGPLLKIGRTPDNDLTLPHPLVARRHAELRLSDEGVLFIDLGSNTGSFLGEERLLGNQPHRIDDGATLRIGPFVLLYRGVSMPAADAVDDELPATADVPAADTGLAADTGRIAASAISTPREHYPAPRARGTFSRYILDLPVVYHDNEFLGRFLNIFESIWEPLEQRQDHIDMYFDPRTCPVEFLPWLASWFDLALDPEWPEAQRRALLLEAYDLYRWRGTRYGLQRIIELRTGLSPEILDEPGLPFVVRIRAHLTAESGITRQMLTDVIDNHKPAHVGYILELRS